MTRLPSLPCLGGGNCSPTSSSRSCSQEVADRVVFMDEGLVIEQGTPAEVLGAPKHERTQRFLRMVEREADTV